VDLAHVHHMLERIRQGMSFSEALLGAGVLYHTSLIPAASAATNSVITGMAFVSFHLHFVV